jgi:hypothetical protein
MFTFTHQQIVDTASEDKEHVNEHPNDAIILLHGGLESTRQVRTHSK